ncbi:hypothetical protein KRP22_015249 [Phytophthora ramorum]|nr:hypothetical protein KRP22_15303 [Phytophthora ramorum]
MACRTPRELAAACMDHIALEGRAGLSVRRLFAAVEPHDDTHVRRHVWRLLRSSRGALRFFRGSEASATPPQTPSKKRKRPGPCDNQDNSVEVKREMLQAAAVDAALTAEELALLTYEQAVAEQQEQDHQVIVVACEELRHRALNIPVKAIAADLGDEHLRILEAVGHARVQGVTVTTLTKLLAGGTVKRLHNCLDTLISYGLVVKRMMIVARPVMRRLNIIHLPRFAVDFKPQMFDESAGFQSDEQSKKILCGAAEKYLRALPTHSSVLSDLGRDLSLQKRHLEVLRSHIMQEGKVDENFPLELFQAVLQPSRRASLEPKILNCVRYKPPNTRRHPGSRRGIILELGLLHQIYGIIEDSAENGATIVDLRNQIVLPGSKLPYKLVSVLAGMYRLKAESIILGKNKAFRFYLDSMAPSNNSCNDLLSADMADCTSDSTHLSNESANVDDEPGGEVKVERNFTVRANKALKVALGGAEVDGTSVRRREHILERLEDEKIISLSSLRASVFSMEKQRAGMNAGSEAVIFSGGGILTDAEFAIVQEATAKQLTFDAIPEALREKIWSHESQRTAKVLGTLADLGLVLPHKIGMKHLVKILRAGYTDGRDGVLSRALKDNALGGLFRFNKQVRIFLDDNGRKGDDIFSSGDAQVDAQRRSVNELDSVRVVGLTEKTYSFANVLPLRYSFESECDIDRYWEALECLCLEQMAMEVENPRRNEPAVCEVPKPTKTRSRRMYRILSWIPKSRKPAPKHKRGEGDEGDTATFTSSGIVSTNFRPRKKRRRDSMAGSKGYGEAKRRHRKKDAGHDDQSKSGPLTWTDVDEQLLVEYFIDSCKGQWKIAVPQGLQREKEQVAFRNHTISRTGFGLVAIARKLGKRKIDVKKRLKEKLMEPVVKLLFENAKRELQLADNPGGLFHEEVAIRGSTRLTALFRRAVMMIVSPREEYHPLVAEELVSSWSPHEIRLVWRYLWLKNWIVRAPEKERGRGYSTSQRLQDSLKVTTLSYPLLLFQQAAEQESMVSSTLEEITAGKPESSEVGQRGISLHSSDQLFEDDFPINATPGQCALELSCQVLGTCSLTAVHSTILDADAESEDTLATQQTNGKRLPSSTKRESLLNCKSLKDRSGFAAHLANKVNAAKASDLIDSWRVETRMHAVSVEDTHACEAFSLQEVDDNSGLGKIAFRPFQYREESEKALEHVVVAHIREIGEEGLTMPSLMGKLRSNDGDERHAELRMRVARCLNALVDQGVLMCVNGYYEQRYIVKEHGDVWLLRPFSVIPSASSPSKPQVVFEGEKDTLSFPWLKMDGGTNYTFLFEIQRKLLSLIIQAPGITEKRAHTRMSKLLTLQDTREAMSLLVEEGLVYARAVTSPAAQPPTLFKASMAQPSFSAPKVVKLVGSVLSYDRSAFEVHFFPHVECIQRFGSIVQDYQNEVFQND